MASAAAATSGSRRQRREREMKVRAHRRAEITYARNKLKERASEIFEDFTSGSETSALNQSELEAFLLETLQTRQLDENAVQMVADAANKNADGSALFSKQALVQSVNCYKQYTSQTKMIEDVFKKYNKACDGKLTSRELLRLLQDQERKANRAANGIAITLVVSPKDLAYILNQADSNRDGRISRAELLPALAAWDKLAHLKMEQKQMAAETNTADQKPAAKKKAPPKDVNQEADKKPSAKEVPPKDANQETVIVGTPPPKNVFPNLCSRAPVNYLRVLGALSMPLRKVTARRRRADVRPTKGKTRMKPCYSIWATRIFRKVTR